MSNTDNKVKMMKLGDVVDINPRFGNFIEDTAKVSFVPMAGVSEEGKLISEETKSLSEVRKGYRPFKRDDVLLAKITPCMENGKACHANNIEHEFGFGSTEFHVLRAKKEINARYLFYLVWNEPFRRLAKKNMKGAAGQKRVPPEFVASHKIPLPPLPEQKRIAEILDLADDARRKRRENLKLYDDLIRSLFLKTFGDPVSNPMGWEKKPMGKLMTIVRGGSPRPIGKFLGGTYPWIKIGDATKGDDVYLHETKQCIIEEGLNKTRLLPPDSLIFANCGVSLGFARIITFEGCIHDGWLAFSEIDNDLDQIFLLKTLNSITQYFRATAPDGTQPNLNTMIMKNFELILPPKSLQLKYSEQVKELNAQKAREQALYNQHDDLFNSLLQRAFKGELQQRTR